MNSAMSCSMSPVISDLPLDRTNDTTIGNVKYCCRNGTIMPSVIDPSKSKSAFTMNVYKLPPNVDDALHLVPPAGFKIGNGGDSQSAYTCGAPRLIAPSLFPDPYLDYSTNAMKTWQVLILNHIFYHNQMPSFFNKRAKCLVSLLIKRRTCLGKLLTDRVLALCRLVVTSLREQRNLLPSVVCLFPPTTTTPLYPALHALVDVKQMPSRAAVPTPQRCYSLTAPSL